jgi:hypothetical protein
MLKIIIQLLFLYIVASYIFKFDIIEFVKQKLDGNPQVEMVTDPLNQLIDKLDVVGQIDQEKLQQLMEQHHLTEQQAKEKIAKIQAELKKRSEEGQ